MRQFSRPVLVLCALLAGPVRGQGEPRNVILMIADGCGFNHILAADYFEHGRTGAQVYETFPVVRAVSTVSQGRRYDPEAYWDTGVAVEDHPTDSAAAVTALTTGHKSGNGALCVLEDGARTATLVERMEAKGRATGVVTTVPFCHATPAGTTVACADRDRYEDIARDMLLASPVDVIMGAGHPLFDRRGDPAVRPDYRYVGGPQVWTALQAGTAGGDADDDGRPDPWTFVDTLEGFRALGSGATAPRVLGLVRVRETLQLDRAGDKAAAPGIVAPLSGLPDLAVLARGALNVLDGHPGGFFLLIEGGAVDWASHRNQSGRMLEEMADFNRAVAAVVEWIAGNGGWAQNLLVVTADHETGYLSGPWPEGEGPAACRVRHPLENRGPGQVPGMRWNSGDHTTSLVPFFAAGPGSEKFAADPKDPKDPDDPDDPVRGPYFDNTRVGQILGEIADEHRR